MESELVGLIGLVVLFILMFAGVPVAAALGLVGLGGFIVLGGWQGALGLFASTPFAQLAHFTLAVVPLFLLLGEFALQGGISEDAYNTAHKWLGKLPAGLGLTTIAANALFAAASGSSVAAAAIFSKIGFPPMMDNKYDKKLAVGTVAAGGTLAALIPPSAVMVMFAIFTEQSVGTLLIAGIVPGAITAVLYIIMRVIEHHLIVKYLLNIL